MINEQTDYFVLTWRRGNSETPWNWQVCRRSTPMGVHIGASGYTNRISAKAAGTKVLTDLLDGIEHDLLRSAIEEFPAESRGATVRGFPAPLRAARDSRKRSGYGFRESA